MRSPIRTRSARVSTSPDGRDGDGVAPGEAGQRAQAIEPRGQRLHGAPAAGGLAAERAREPPSELAGERLAVAHRPSEEGGPERPRGPGEPLARARIVARHRAAEAGAEIVHAPRPVPERPAGVGQDPPAAEVGEPVGEAPGALVHRRD